jgi:dienelactone hydrolase
MTRQLFVLSFLALVFGSCASAPPPAPAAKTAPPIWSGLEPGEFAVGFKSWMLRAQAADFKFAPPHPIQISVWYPAEPRGASMHYRDYLLLSLTEKTPEEPTEAQRKAGLDDFTKFLTSAGLSAKSAQTLIETPMFAHLNAPSLTNRRFPMVVIVQGNDQAAAAQAVLAEYLASHGYVVVTTPSITRLTTPLTNIEDTGKKSVEQAEDTDRAASAIGDWPNAVNIPVSVIGHSFGARGALIYAMHHPTNALISLDGGIGSTSGTRSMLNEKMLDLTAEIPPVLHFYEVLDDRSNPDFRLLRSLRTPKLDLVRMDSMQHIHFTTDGFAAAMLPEFAKITKAGPDLHKELLSMAQQTLAFLDKQWASRRPVS